MVKYSGEKFKVSNFRCEAHPSDLNSTDFIGPSLLETTLLEVIKPTIVTPDDLNIISSMQ